MLAEDRDDVAAVVVLPPVGAGGVGEQLPDAAGVLAASVSYTAAAGLGASFAALMFACYAAVIISGIVSSRLHVIGGANT